MPLAGELATASGRIADADIDGATFNDPEVEDSFLAGKIPCGIFAAPCAAAANSAWLLTAFGTTAAGEDSAFVETTDMDELPEGVFGVGVPLLLPTAMTTTFLLTRGEGLDFVAETIVT